MGKFIDLKDQTFDRLYVVSFSHKDEKGRMWWNCHCSCGTDKPIRAKHLRAHAVKSCGCLPEDIKRLPVDGYGCYSSMIQRCCNPKDKQYWRYGGRGIKVCDRWRESAKNFFEDMGPRPSRKHSIDRFPDQDGDYQPGNCRWATKQEQARNRRNNRLYEHNGVSRLIIDWAEHTGINVATIKSRLRLGWPFAEAIEAVQHIYPYVAHCIHGHPMSGENLYIAPKSQKRFCKACRRIWAQRSLERRKEQETA